MNSKQMEKAATGAKEMKPLPLAEDADAKAKEARDHVIHSSLFQGMYAPVIVSIVVLDIESRALHNFCIAEQFSST